MRSLPSSEVIEQLHREIKGMCERLEEIASSYPWFSYSLNAVFPSDRASIRGIHYCNGPTSTMDSEMGLILESMTILYAGFRRLSADPGVVLRMLPTFLQLVGLSCSDADFLILAQSVRDRFKHYIDSLSDRKDTDDE